MRDDKKFLDTLLDRRVDVYLTSGVRLSARLASHLPFAVLLDDNHRNGLMMVYKHAISSIALARAERS